MFCSRCNTTTPFGLSVEGGEFHGTCQNVLPNPDPASLEAMQCGHVVKFMAATADELKAQIAAHNAENKPAVTAAMVEDEKAAKASILDSLDV